VFYPIYRFVRLAWRYRRLIALLLTVIAGLLERNRHRLPARMQGIDLARIPGVKAPGPTGSAPDAAPGPTD
jgi:hypothetical protein